MGQTIEFRANGGMLSGYLAEPAPDKANGRGIVVLQEWWGLVPHICDVADRFAAEGYLALAPDLWRGEQTTSPDEAGRMLMALDIEKTEADLRGAISELGTRGTKGKIAVIGFCMGGQLALMAATENPALLSAAVDFYGIHPNVKPDFAKLGCPVLGVFGGEDSMVSPDVVAQLVKDIEAAGKSIDYTIFPGCDHAFFNDTRSEVYNPTAAKQAWDKTLAFLDQHMA